MNSDNLQPDQLDSAVQTRLRRLSTIPCDSTGLVRRIDSAIEELREDDESASVWTFRLRQPLIAAAALIAIAATLAIALTYANRGADAIRLSEVVHAHQSYLDNGAHVVNVQSVEQANHECQARWPGAPTIPNVDGVSVQCCCVEEMCGCPAACLHFDHNGVPVTMAVVTGAQFDDEGVTTVERGGRSYSVHTEGRFSVVAMRGPDRCICLVSELPREDLLALATRIDS
ncbi:MAG: hypothetical protein KJO18_05495 [Acidimicrobiia bacterium]|nr:hypothetical protein [Acidimicrobiia bacterium]